MCDQDVSCSAHRETGWNCVRYRTVYKQTDDLSAVDKTKIGPLTPLQMLGTLGVVP
jgi:hypothetical protein